MKNIFMVCIKIMDISCCNNIAFHGLLYFCKYVPMMFEVPILKSNSYITQIHCMLEDPGKVKVNL